MSESDQSEIIEDILSQARAEAEDIREKNTESLKRRRQSLEQQVARIQKDAEERTEEQVSRLRTQWQRNQALEERRIQLELQERLVRVVTEGAQNEISEMRGSDRYRSVLKDWTVEAVVGLGVKEAVVRCAPEDAGTLDRILPEVREAVAGLTDTQPDMSIAENKLPSGSVGVVVVDAEGRQAFSNRLKDRVRRSVNDIRRIVVEELFGEDQHE